MLTTQLTKQHSTQFLPSKHNPPKCGRNTIFLAFTAIPLRCLLSMADHHLVQDDTLCRRCNSIQWAKLASRIDNLDRKWEWYQPFLKLGHDEISSLKKSECSVCQLLLAILPSSAQKSEQLVFYAFPSQTIFRHTSVDVKDSTVIFAKLEVKHRPASVRMEEGRYEQQFVELINESRAVVPAVINYDLVKRWIKKCRHNHASPCCSSSGTPPLAGFRVIDYQTSTVISAPPDCDYVAPSYVWGTSSNNPQLDYTKVVNDSIIAASALGYRYLWVNRYCIDQDNFDEKHDQIAKMDLIYAHAALTFIDLAGRCSVKEAPFFHRPASILQLPQRLSCRIDSRAPYISFQ
ncbi:heterokaryon incompatibility protein-domain-containing protein [Podospora fimiseda]|uniref:Heterokaryon incompatibility protein-domain-containing protein n=1 Tax=Podospora fimiseda TaxID=252190 RepID=A0AAN7BHU7_9PEZI|nr:heterokaryon incompatibility protein-domain-containing protein [Podospora fimiseda]